MIRSQSGIPKIPRNRYGRQANGLLTRGIVIATYVTDDTAHPMFANDLNPPIAVYCDVLVMPSIAGQRWFVLPNCLVVQDVAGLHRGRIWKPRAATVDWNHQELNINGGSDPKSIDGDNVLVGFLNDNLNQPLILGALPHPATDLDKTNADLGQRMKLTLADGDPDFWRHHGVYGGVTDQGNYVVDSTYANDGSINENGSEPDPPTDGKGSVDFKLPKDANFKIVLYDMSNPTSPTEVFNLECTETKFDVRINDGDSILLEGKEGAATLKIGNGAVKAAIADHLQTLWGTLKTWLEAHTHPTGTGPSGTPLNSPATTWNTNINSQKLMFPDN